MLYYERRKEIPYGVSERTDEMKKYQISYEHAYGVDHATVYADTKKEARKIFNANKPIAGSKIIEVEEV